MKIKGFTRSLALAAAATAAVAASSASAHAGFLDELFGGASAPQTAPAPAPEPSYNAPQPDGGGVSQPRPAYHAKKKVVAAVERTPTLQKTTDLMSDKTLRPGDAVMMKSGVHIYDGPSTSHHDADEFVALDEARHVPAQAHDQLAAMDVTRRAPLTYVSSNATVVEGRSSGGPNVSEGYKITDARGRSIRYVGP